MIIILYECVLWYLPPQTQCTIFDCTPTGGVASDTSSWTSFMCLFFFFFPENLDERKQQRKKLLTSCIRTSHITNKKNTHVYGQFTTSMKLHWQWLAKNDLKKKKPFPAVSTVWSTFWIKGCESNCTTTHQMDT